MYFSVEKTTDFTWPSSEIRAADGPTLLLSMKRARERIQSARARAWMDEMDGMDDITHTEHGAHGETYNNNGQNNTTHEKTNMKKRRKKN